MTPNNDKTPFVIDNTIKRRMNEERRKSMIQKATIGNEEQNKNRTRIFVDMDGTLAEFNNVPKIETLYEKGYFLSRAPMENVVKAIRSLVIKKQKDFEVFILSAYLTDSAYALNEKNAWLDKYLPEIDRDHRIFVPCGTIKRGHNLTAEDIENNKKYDKRNYIPDGIRETDLLLDDYTNNLVLWQPPAKGVKLLNGINHTKGTWKGNMITANKNAYSIYDDICRIARGDTIRNEIPTLNNDGSDQPENYVNKFLKQKSQEKEK